MSSKRSPEDSPHYVPSPDVPVEFGSQASIDAHFKKPRRKMIIQPESLLGPQPVSNPPVEVNPSSPPDQPVLPDAPVATRQEAELRERNIRLRSGAWMYEVKYSEKTRRIIIPRTEDDVEELLLGGLPTDLSLRVDKNSLARGKTKGTIFNPIGRSAYGAFIVVHYIVENDGGKEVDIPMLVDINDRRTRKENEVVKFQESIRRLLFSYR